MPGGENMTALTEQLAKQHAKERFYNKQST